MAQWDRFEICAAYAALEADYNVGGLLQERPSNLRRRESIGCQLHRMRYSAGGYGGTFSALNDNEQEIYLERVLQWGLPIDAEIKRALLDVFVPEYLVRRRPDVFKQSLDSLPESLM